jgi:hypothetical protein
MANMLHKWQKDIWGKAVDRGPDQTYIRQGSTRRKRGRMPERKKPILGVNTCFAEKEQCKRVYLLCHHPGHSVPPTPPASLPPPGTPHQFWRHRSRPPHPPPPVAPFPQPLPFGPRPPPVLSASSCLLCCMRVAQARNCPPPFATVVFSSPFDKHCQG